MDSEIATIRIGADYFRNCAKKDYVNPPTWVWIREALQNSLDAGATKVEIELTDSHISVLDNGCGMSKEVIQDKLLVLGGTQKSAGSVGGFGKAKEILFFAWNWWSITSSPTKNDTYIITSEMIGKQPIKHKVGQTFRGTNIMIDYSGSGYCKDNWEGMIYSLVCHATTRARIYLNGEQIPTLEARGIKSEYDFCTLRINKSKPSRNIIVRISGVPMFFCQLNVQLEATVTVDLKGNSTQILAANRDSLNYNYEYKLRSILSKFEKNPKSSITNASNKPIVFDEYKVKMHKVHELVKVTTDPELSRMVARVEANISYGESADEMIERIEKVDPALGRKLRIIVKGQYTSPLGYMFVVRRNNNARPSIDPLSNKAQTILHCWNKVVGKLMNKHYPEMQYTVGLTYKPTDKASYIKHDGVTYFLINPTLVPKYGDYLSLGHYVFIEAAHEVSHVANEDHDENFTMTWSTIMQDMGVEPRKWKKVFLEAKQEIRVIANDIENKEMEVY